MEQVKRPKKPLMFYYTIVLIILILFNIIAMPYIKEKQIKDVDYGTFASPATAFASIVLPVPGGPTRRIPFGIDAPISLYLAGL